MPALGVLMLRDGLVEREQLEAFLEEHRNERQHGISGWRLGEMLVGGSAIRERVVRLCLDGLTTVFEMRRVLGLPADSWARHACPSRFGAVGGLDA